MKSGADTMIERIARAMEPRAFDTYAGGYTSGNWLEERAFLNAEKVVKRARKKAALALQAMKEPTPAMVAVVADDEHGEWAITSFKAMIEAALTENGE